MYMNQEGGWGVGDETRKVDGAWGIKLEKWMGRGGLKLGRWMGSGV
jgi:hypothetical protein